MSAEEATRDPSADGWAVTDELHNNHTGDGRTTCPSSAGRWALMQLLEDIRRLQHPTFGPCLPFSVPASARARHHPSPRRCNADCLRAHASCKRDCDADEGRFRVPASSQRRLCALQLPSFCVVILIHLLHDSKTAVSAWYGRNHTQRHLTTSQGQCQGQGQGHGQATALGLRAFSN